MYAEDTAPIYDLMYSGKDYAAESAALTGLIRERVPRAASLLDVACGTGSHLRHLGASFTAEGLELSPQMTAIARGQGHTVTEGDMRDFTLGRRFDAVVCLFGSIGYAGGATGLDAAVARMAAHLAPGGVLVIENFHQPGEFFDGYRVADGWRDERRAVTRLSVSEHHGAVGVMNMHVMVADDAGVRSFLDRHEMSLYSTADFARAFGAAGLDVARVEGILPRALYVGVARKS
ncbi:class I SAM-dependent methyltransferase [Phytomonospora endophytica]|uniref:SAM-dependent methyltransferase n=1 Tax=Phytomonospora endophytica TaxID=714109 RepID=A0A841FLY1_9ACTN|nr:class I SAM-dependent methyltransferase [Phytomonospora endophytica]MBB6037005.1 SAM-dependent methyltransferase [Phytomonospora endophytica]GIG69451.1 methyltransferase type 11 [Phytomonospora endophytica]